MSISVITENTTAQNAVADDQYTGIEDRTLDESSPTQTDPDGGFVGVLNSSPSGTDRHGLFRITGLSNIPSSAIVSSVKLYLRSVFTDAGTVDIDLRRCLQPWIAGQSSWDNYSTGNAWDSGGALTDGIDRLATPESTTSVDSSGGMWYVFDFTALGSDIIDGTIAIDNGLLATTDDEAGTIRLFDSSEGTDGQRPEVVVIFTLPASGVTGTISSILTGFNQGLSGNAESQISGAISSTLQGFNQGLDGNVVNNTISGSVGSTLKSFNQGLLGNIVQNVNTGTITSTLTGFNQGLLGNAVSNISGIISSILKSFNQGLNGNVVNKVVIGSIDSTLKSFNQGLDGNVVQNSITGVISSTLQGFNQGLIGDSTSNITGIIGSTLKGFTQGLLGSVIIPNTSTGTISSLLQGFNQGLNGSVITNEINGSVGSILKGFSQGLLGNVIVPNVSTGTITSLLKGFSQGIFGVIIEPTDSFTFEQLILNASSLSEGATLEQHLFNLNAGGGACQKEISPVGISSSTLFGSPTVVLERIVNINVVGIPSTSIVGSPTIFSVSPTIEIAPSERSIIALKENRIYNIESENRVYIMAKEERKYNIDKEDRTFVVTAIGKIMKEINKDPDSVLNYSFNFGNWLETGDTISFFQLIDSSGIAIDSSTNTTTTVTAIISGGSDSGDESLTCRITTANGLTEDRTIIFKMGDR